MLPPGEVLGTVEQVAKQAGVSATTAYDKILPSLVAARIVERLPDGRHAVLVPDAPVQWERPEPAHIRDTPAWVRVANRIEELLREQPSGALLIRAELEATLDVNASTLGLALLDLESRGYLARQPDGRLQVPEALPKPAAPAGAPTATPDRDRRTEVLGPGRGAAGGAKAPSPSVEGSGAGQSQHRTAPTTAGAQSPSPSPSPPPSPRFGVTVADVAAPLLRSGQLNPRGAVLGDVEAFASASGLSREALERLVLNRLQDAGWISVDEDGVVRAARPLRTRDRPAWVKAIDRIRTTSRARAAGTSLGALKDLAAQAKMAGGKLKALLREVVAQGMLVRDPDTQEYLAVGPTGRPTLAAAPAAPERVVNTIRQRIGTLRRGAQAARPGVVIGHRRRTRREHGSGPVRTQGGEAAGNEPLAQAAGGWHSRRRAAAARGATGQGSCHRRLGRSCRQGSARRTHRHDGRGCRATQREGRGRQRGDEQPRPRWRRYTRRREGVLQDRPGRAAPRGHPAAPRSRGRGRGCTGSRAAGGTRSAALGACRRNGGAHPGGFEARATPAARSGRTSGREHGHVPE